jgi:hypothetical protein
MFDMSKLGDISRLASQAKQVQASQEKAQREQTELLRKISEQLDSLLAFLTNGG